MKMALEDTMVEREEIDATEWSKTKPLLKKQFKTYVDFRRDEGMSLEKEFQHVLAIFSI
jgi:hypothetical protein